MYSGMKCSIGERTKNVIFNSQYIEDYEAIPLNIGQLNDIWGSWYGKCYLSVKSESEGEKQC